LSPEIKARLLASVDAGRLVVLCGAGLSMAAPSNLPSARRVAEICFDVYALKVDPLLNPALREDLEALAEHFAALNTLKSQFIENLVPWSEFVRPPNPGHAAIADFLITKAVVAALSSNYDKLIEQCGWDYGADFFGSLDGDEATVCSRRQAPLLKFHGCSYRDRANTLWAPSQLNDLTVAERIEKSRIWMAANLRQKDLLVVGFWSDWEYLNQTIGGAVQGLDPLSVTVIDPFGTEQLQQKAPQLWALAHQVNVTFTHIQESGADALDELRRAFSESYLRQVLASGKSAFEAEIGSVCEPTWLNVAGLDSESLYSWRRDAEGVPVGRPARANLPTTDEALGYFHLLLRRAGAVQGQAWYSFGGRQIRVINGAGSFLSTVAARFVEPPSVPAAELCIAVGASDLGLPGNVLRAGAAGSLVRPATTSKWLTLEQARVELEI
jgi:hypothetical protein